MAQTSCVGKEGEGDGAMDRLEEPGVWSMQCWVLPHPWVAGWEGGRDWLELQQGQCQLNVRKRPSRAWLRAPFPGGRAGGRPPGQRPLSRLLLPFPPLHAEDVGPAALPYDAAGWVQVLDRGTCVCVGHVCGTGTHVSCAEGPAHPCVHMLHLRVAASHVPCLCQGALPYLQASLSSGAQPFACGTDCHSCPPQALPPRGCCVLSL